MWQVWLSLEQDFREAIPFDPLFEVLKSNEGAKLLAPVPQLMIPMGASASADFHTTIADASVWIEHLVESRSADNLFVRLVVF
jgi:hypothetical protein